MRAGVFGLTIAVVFSILYRAGAFERLTWLEDLQCLLWPVSLLFIGTVQVSLSYTATVCLINGVLYAGLTSILWLCWPNRALRTLACGAIAAWFAWFAWIQWH